MMIGIGTPISQSRMPFMSPSTGGLVTGGNAARDKEVPGLRPHPLERRRRGC